MGNTANRVKLTDYLLGQQSDAFGRSYVINPSAFENVNTIAASGTATVARNTTTPLTAISDIAITLPNNATDGVTWTLNTLDNALNGQNCELRFDYTASSIGSVVVAQVLQGANVIAQSSALTTASTAKTISLNATCGSLASATTLKITNFTANSGTSAMNVANVTYGKATNLTSVFPATDFATNLTWTVEGAGTQGNQSVSYRRVGDTLQVQGYVMTGTVSGSITGAIDIPASIGVIDSTKMGTDVNAEIVGTWTSTIASAGDHIYSGNLAGLLMYDGSTTSKVFIVYGSSATAKQYEKDVGSASMQSNNAFSFQFNVPIAGWSSNSQLSVNSNANQVFVRYHASAAQTATSAAQVNFDTKDDDTCSPACVTTTTAGTAGTWKFTAPYNGYYRVSAIIKLNTSASTLWQLFKNGSVYLGGLFSSATSNWSFPAVYELPLVAGDTIDIRPNGSTALRGQDPISNTDITTIQISMIGGVQNAPVLIGSVTVPNDNAAYRMESYSTTSACTTGTCVASFKTAGITNVTWSSTGNYVLNFATNWSGGYACTLMATNLMNSINSQSSSAYGFETANGSATAVNTAFNIICMGPK